ncbi:hypothetical protein BJ878DRAFT_571847 [Calycina marina]|uniref:Uncharacterized protein n=1 Tax=Calycina marina TaxID=1763456 RepID=A0A9P7ZBG6_9HELO|nr:hypothetical protein BJ878DRAFT_571847 [Calycina marina]
MLCDQKALLDGCTQCFRAKRTCPGYRFLTEFISRNESASVREKHQAKAARSVATSTASKVLTRWDVPSSTSRSFGYSGSSSLSGSENPLENSSEYDDGVLEVVRQASTSISRSSLAPGIEDQATAFFVTHYVVNEAGPTKGTFNNMLSMCNADENVGLLSAMKAVGIAGVAHTAGESSLYNNSRYHYLKAIQGTSNALRAPESVRKDSTLTAIMVLSIYETVTGINNKSVHDWAEHIRGAAALLELRGRCVHPNDKLFAERDTQPGFIVEWTQDIREQFPFHETAFLLQQAMMKFTQFQAAVNDGSFSDPNEIVKQALELDAIYVALYSDTLPDEWKYKTNYTDQCPEMVWNGRYNVYHDFWIAQVWNEMSLVTLATIITSDFTC